MKRIIKGIKEKPIGFSMNLFIFEQITKSKTAEIIGKIEQSIVLISKLE